MTYIATITSKRQITLPVKAFRNKNFAKGDKVIITETNTGLSIRRAFQAVEQLVGSVKISANLKKVSLEKAISVAKGKHAAALK